MSVPKFSKHPALIASCNRVELEIPFDDWELIRRDWEKRNLAEGRHPDLLRIVVDDEETERRNSRACCEAISNIIFFSSDATRWPDDVRDTLLAHEMAHSYHAATDDVFDDLEEEEKHANETMKSWGYDHTLIIQYQEFVNLRRKIEYTEEEQAMFKDAAEKFYAKQRETTNE